MNNITIPYLIRYQISDSKYVGMIPLDIQVKTSDLIREYNAMEIYGEIEFEMEKLQGKTCNILAVFKL